MRGGRPTKHSSLPRNHPGYLTWTRVYRLGFLRVNALLATTRAIQRLISRTRRAQAAVKTEINLQGSRRSEFPHYHRRRWALYRTWLKASALGIGVLDLYTPLSRFFLQTQEGMRFLLVLSLASSFVWALAESPPWLPFAVIPHERTCRCFWARLWPKLASASREISTLTRCFWGLL